MKHSFLFCLVLFTLSLSGQVSSGRFNSTISTTDNTYMLDIGIQSGVGCIWLNKPQKDLRTLEFGYMGGLSFQYNFPKVLSLQTGVNYERKGTRFKIPVSYVDQNGNITGRDKMVIRLKLDYLTIPLILRASFGSDFKYFVNAGIYRGYLLKGTFLHSATKYESAAAFDDTKSYKQSETGGILGIGVSTTPEKEYYFSCELRNSFGLTDISSYGGLDVKPKSISLLVGFAYRFGERRYKKAY